MGTDRDLVKNNKKSLEIGLFVRKADPMDAVDYFGLNFCANHKGRREIAEKENRLCSLGNSFVLRSIFAQTAFLTVQGAKQWQKAVGNRGMIGRELRSFK